MGDRAGVLVEFCGEQHEVPVGGAVTVGREGDVRIDDNPYLHRQFLAISLSEEGVCLLSNVGSLIHATASDDGGRMEAYLAPGVAVPLVFPVTRVSFAAGSTSYEFFVRNNAPTRFEPSFLGDRPFGESTLGPASLTPSQRKLIVALAEDRLRGDAGQRYPIPPSSEVAARLGWPITTFNRKLDNVCEKLAGMGVRGLLGKPGIPANNRRSRLVEYALATGLVTPEHLTLLDEGRE